MTVPLHDLPGRDGLSRVWSLLPDARLVGGVVRDMLAGRTVTDLDLATPEPPQAVMDRLRGDGIKVIPTGLTHGTVTALVDGHPLEITTLRRDVETDGRHAVVAWTDDWREDAARRDFTINAMSVDRHAGLHDYFDGAADLHAGRVRFVGDAATRIAEDALRILRFFRFHARYGRGVADPAATDAIGAAAQSLQHLSAERVWTELRRLLEAPAPAPALVAMHRLGVLDALLPQGGDPPRLMRLLALQAPPDPLLRLAGLAVGDAATVAARLKLSNADADRLHALMHGVRPHPGLDDDGLRRLLVDSDAVSLCDRGWLLAATSDDPADDPAPWFSLCRRLHALDRPVFPVSGRDVVAAGLQPGPAVGAALRAVEGWWRENGCRPDRAACLARLGSLLRG